MILLENDFLKTYNEIDSLWEGIDYELVTEALSYDFSTSFEDVADRAKEDAAKKETDWTEEIVDYWRNVRFLLMNKMYRKGQWENQDWCTRFMTFYRPYKAEQAILEKLNEISTIDFAFGDGDSHHVLHKDDNAVVDIVSSDKSIKLECKTEGAHNFSIHGANVVIMHTGISNKCTETSAEIQFYLLARNKALTQKFLDSLIDSNLKLNPPIKSKYLKTDSVKPLSCTVSFSIPPTAILANLRIIDDRLTGFFSDTKLARLNRHIGDTENLANALTGSGSGVSIEDNTTLDQALADLAAVTNHLINNIS